MKDKNQTIENPKFKDKIIEYNTLAHSHLKGNLPCCLQNKMVMSLESGDALSKTLDTKDYSPSMTLRCCLSINDLVPYKITKASLQVAFDDCTMTLRLSLYIQR